MTTRKKLPPRTPFEVERARRIVATPVVEKVDVNDIIRIMDAYSGMMEPRSPQEKLLLQRRAVLLVRKYSHLRSQP